MQTLKGSRSDARTSLQKVGLKQKVLHLRPGQVIYRQGAPAVAIIYLEMGRAKVCVNSAAGKEATISLVSAGDFLGEEAIAPAARMHLATATAITACTLIWIEREEVLRAVQESGALPEKLLAYLVIRNIRIQADLVDLLFNSSEKRLARTLLLMADNAEAGNPVSLLPPITQDMLAEIVGTTRSRVNYFMNRFRDLGFIEYNRRIRVHKILLHQVLGAAEPQHLPQGRAGTA